MVLVQILISVDLAQGLNSKLLAVQLKVDSKRAVESLHYCCQTLKEINSVYHIQKSSALGLLIGEDVPKPAIPMLLVYREEGSFLTLPIAVVVVVLIVIVVLLLVVIFYRCYCCYCCYYCC